MHTIANCTNFVVLENTGFAFLTNEKGNFKLTTTFSFRQHVFSDVRGKQRNTCLSKQQLTCVGDLSDNVSVVSAYMMPGLADGDAVII